MSDHAPRERVEDERLGDKASGGARKYQTDFSNVARPGCYSSGDRMLESGEFVRNFWTWIQGSSPERHEIS